MWITFYREWNGEIGDISSYKDSPTWISESLQCYILAEVLTAQPDGDFDTLAWEVCGEVSLHSRTLRTYSTLNHSTECIHSAIGEER